MAASHLHAMTEVAKPVSLSAASRAQRAFTAVTTMRAARIGNASANVSSMKTPLTYTSACSHGKWRVTQPGDGIVRESYGTILIEVPLDVVRDTLVELRPHVKAMPGGRASEVAFLDDQHAALHDVARRG